MQFVNYIITTAASQLNHRSFGKTETEKPKIRMKTNFLRIIQKKTVFHPRLKRNAARDNFARHPIEAPKLQRN